MNATIHMNLGILKDYFEGVDKDSINNLLNETKQSILGAKDASGVILAVERLDSLPEKERRMVLLKLIHGTIGSHQGSSEHDASRGLYV
jgi:hypothetical protein